MVEATEYPNLREASCCKVEVVKGGAGVFLAGLVSKNVKQINCIDWQNAVKPHRGDMSVEKM